MMNVIWRIGPCSVARVQEQLQPERDLYYVLVPSSVVLRAEDLRLAIRHEQQHHRQQDTKLVYLQQLLKAAFFWSPAIHHLEGQLT